MNMSGALRQGLARYFTAEQLEKLQAARVGIAGAGGLGSNVAMLLARSGIEDMLIIDDDTVDASNLNRQQYWPQHIGQPKVQAMAEQLRQLNSYIKITPLQTRLTADTLPLFLPQASIWVEALDQAHIKKMFVDQALLAQCRVACASGIAGYGGVCLTRRRCGNLVAVGDFETGTDQAPPLGPRVAQAAALLADIVLEWVLDG